MPECADGGEKGGLLSRVTFPISRILKLSYMGMKNVQLRSNGMV